MGEQQNLDLFRELNRYDERGEDWPSAEVFEAPRRTLSNGWRKFHATHDCGAGKVSFVEDTNHRALGEKYEYRLRCWNCGFRIDEDDVLFIGGDWYSRHGWESYGRPLDDLQLPNERVLELGPDPDHAELIRALSLTRIEREASVHGVSFGNETYDECEVCEKETMVRFDGRCRMCYDGEWTDRMQSTVEVLGESIMKRNNSFAHRVEREIDPCSIHDRAFADKVLWRRGPGPYSKVVEVTQALTDEDDGHHEYVVTALDGSAWWLVEQDELERSFWDTGLYRGSDDDRIRDLRERVFGDE